MDLPSKSKKKLFSVSINTPHCLTFDLGLIKNVKIKESPVWLKEWLVVNQVSPVNNLVDSVNLVKLETRQSLQIYDYDFLAKKKRIVVEKTEINEIVESPGSEELTTLTFDDLVVRFDREFVSLTEFDIEDKEKFG